MFENSIDRRRSRGKKGPTMDARPPRRPRPQVLRLDSSSSEDSVIGPPPTRQTLTVSIESESDHPRSDPRRLMTGQKVGSPQTPKPFLSVLLKDRELGRSSGLLGRRKVQSQIRDTVHKNPLRKTKSWVGASGDVLVAAWSPNGSSYAFGSSTDLDPSSAQYNRRNNLLFGDVNSLKLYELPDHYVDRALATQTSPTATSNTLDPELYTTITSLAFDKSGKYLYTSSYDKTVKVWDLQGEKPKVTNTLGHNTIVTHLASSTTYSGSFVTGQGTKENSIRVFTNHKLNQPIMYLESSKAHKFREPIFPSVLRLGTGHMAQYLLAGFAENNPDPMAEDKHGDICLWDLNTSKLVNIRGNSQAVSDLSWHSQSQFFAAATKPGNRSLLGNKYQTRSLVKLWEPLSMPSVVSEYECPALDINEVHFHPWDQNLLVASCTNGVSYVWDYRMGDTILHKFQHDKPIDEPRPNEAREAYDTGVQMVVWSKDGKRLLTGASDGIIKSWDIFASPEDAFQGDAAHFSSGIMCGTWSPDHRDLLIGLAQGAVEILTTDPPDDEDDSASDKEIEFIPAKPPKAQALAEEESGIAIARGLLASQQLTMHPIYGAGKGPNYKGPYAIHAHPVDDKGNCDLDRLLPEVAALQLDEPTRRQARREGGETVKKMAKKVGRKIYKNAEILARARNVAMLGREAEEREVVFLGKRERRMDDVRYEDRKGKAKGGQDKTKRTVKREALSLYGEDEAWEDPLEEDHWF